MSLVVLDQTAARTFTAAREAHVLLVVQDQKARYQLADLLLDAGFRLTLASSYGLADLLLDESAGVDVLVTALPLHDMGQFGLAQLARAVRPDLPILVVDEETAGGPGVVQSVGQIMRRWPMRDWAAPALQ
jgi:DNA-binding NtrC family response regulator